MQALNEQQKAKLLKRASTASVVTAGVLLVAKLVAWGMTGSVSILATFMDSLLDAFASIINLVAISIALKPADEDHHYGHGKAEQLAALAQSAFIAGSGLFLILHAVNGISNGTVIENNQIALSVMAFSMAVTMGLVMYQNYVVKQTGSLAIQTDSMHYRMDLLTNLGVVIALILATAGLPLADPMIGIAIAVYMIFSVGTVAWQAIQMLMDQALDQEKEQLIREQVLAVEGVLDLHNLRTRMSGVTPVIQMDLDINGGLTLEAAHHIGKVVEHRLLAHMPDADITIHLDPN
ncbi:cation diffusion facilitator family transporter [Sansalvadorimonas verongulae]|uniref:cation diffusion facilitator family transporter n=1 Tax=Sansalvadorimonas verongulae TaxID=2172824 RepID=UPI0012BD717B|nr:cation diffusion facilitator family transporter [Sansalvadorimonas verongulae]MTI12295.1 cation diffusion facilitator family transporter [Sansalvadorimonas verongulae]